MQNYNLEADTLYKLMKLCLNVKNIGVLDTGDNKDDEGENTKETGQTCWCFYFVLARVPLDMEAKAYTVLRLHCTPLRILASIKYFKDYYNQLYVKKHQSPFMFQASQVCWYMRGFSTRGYLTWSQT